jgi:hypothetical protein
LLEQSFVAARDPSGEPLRFLLSRIDWHENNLCRRGTHCEN